MGFIYFIIVLALGIISNIEIVSTPDLFSVQNEECYTIKTMRHWKNESGKEFGFVVLQTPNGEIERMLWDEFNEHYEIANI